MVMVPMMAIMKTDTPISVFLLFVIAVGFTVFPCAVCTSGVTPAAIFQDINGSLHINASSGQAVLFNGVDVVAKLVDLERRMLGFTSSPEPVNNGTTLWTQLLGSSSNDLAFGAAADSSGNVYVVGYTSKYRWA